ncbi:hypothetical protein H0H87_008943 [Tephrocybe sp. NHM501043]|nr:hypothetical protein H0H87_008943 [Tephrocybe sp. NHM501043]
MPSAQNRDSHTVRASVYDICLQLGAFDDNSLVAEWMFSDRSSNGGTSSDRREEPVRFQEVVSSDFSASSEENVPKPRRRFLSFFDALRSISMKKPSIGGEPSHPPNRAVNRSSRVSLRRSSFFKGSGRTTNTATFSDNGRISTNPNTFFQRKLPSHGTFQIPPTLSVSTCTVTPTHPGSINHDNRRCPLTSHMIQEDDGDEIWEEIEAIPDSPLYPLPNKGMNPPAVYSRKVRKSRSDRENSTDLNAAVDEHAAAHFNFTLAFFQRSARQFRNTSSHQRRTSSMSSPRFTGSSSNRNSAMSSSPAPRKKLKINTPKARHIRKPSNSLPPSPFGLLKNDGSNFVAATDAPARPTSESVLPAKESDMGYHHQFFVQAEKEALEKCRSGWSSMSPKPPVVSRKNAVLFPSKKVSHFSIVLAIQQWLTVLY